MLTLSGPLNCLHSNKGWQVVHYISEEQRSNQCGYIQSEPCLDISFAPLNKWFSVWQCWSLPRRPGPFISCHCGKIKLFKSCLKELLLNEDLQKKNELNSSWMLCSGCHFIPSATQSHRAQQHLTDLTAASRPVFLQLIKIKLKRWEDSTETDIAI